MQAPMACPRSPLAAHCLGFFSGRTNMIYELRIYECVPGRLPDLNKRFSTITLKLWEKHGIKQAGFWTTVIGESNQTLYYLLAWESLAEREKKWNAFGADPEWLNARAQTEANGPIVANVKNFILAPTPYSSVQ
jgi:NIPSNAP